MFCRNAVALDCIERPSAKTFGCLFKLLKVNHDDLAWARFAREGAGVPTFEILDEPYF